MRPHNRRCWSFTSSTVAGLSPDRGSRTITAGSEFHRPRSTSNYVRVYQRTVFGSIPELSGFASAHPRFCQEARGPPSVADPALHSRGPPGVTDPALPFARPARAQPCLSRTTPASGTPGTTSFALCAQLLLFFAKWSPSPVVAGPKSELNSFGRSCAHSVAVTRTPQVVGRQDLEPRAEPRLSA